MLRPKDIRENLDNFNDVTRDAIEHMVAIRGEDDVIPDLENELAKWATECKFCVIVAPVLLLLFLYVFIVIQILFCPKKAQKNKHS